MRQFIAPLALVASVLAIGPVVAQAPSLPGASDPTRVTGGTYVIDPAHTQAVFSYSHFGFSNNLGLISEFTGNLVLDPKKPDAASVTVDIPVSQLQTGIPKFQEHLASADFFEFAKYPTAKFVSTSVKVDGTTAEITGNLTLKGITKPITLDAQFVAAGTNPMNKKETIGFAATGVIKRSEFGLGKYAPLVSDEVELKIITAFEK